MDTKEVYNRQSKTVYLLAMTYLKNVVDAEDAVQSIFIKYIERKPKFASLEHEKAWFITVTKNYCKDILKNFWKRKVDIGVVSEKSYVEKDKEFILLDKIMELPVKYREVLFLYYYEEYSVREISEVLSRKESTIQTQLMTARQKLKFSLGKEEQ